MTKRWYIVHAYTNFEKKVADAILEAAEARGLREKFEDGSCFALAPPRSVMRSSLAPSRSAQGT
jgi:hypothetical protein